MVVRLPGHYEGRIWHSKGAEFMMAGKQSKEALRRKGRGTDTDPLVNHCKGEVRSSFLFPVPGTSQSGPCRKGGEGIRKCRLRWR